MTDIEQLKYIVKNGTCHKDISCRACTFGKCCDYGCLDNIGYDMVKDAKKLLNELRVKKLKSVLK
jgi:hypothetical protein